MCIQDSSSAVCAYVCVEIREGNGEGRAREQASKSKMEIAIDKYKVNSRNPYLKQHNWYFAAKSDAMQ